MIALQNVSVKFSGAEGPILRDTTLRISPKERIGIVAAPGSGKSTLARVFCGIEPPQRGQVTSDGVSWPLGFAGFFHPNVNVLTNLKIIARLSDQDPDTFVGLVASLAEIDGQLWRDMRDVSPTQRAVIAYMCSIVSPATLFVADDSLTVGSARIRQKCEVLLNRRLEHTGLVFLSRNPRQIGQYCDRYYALSHARLIPCESPEIAQLLVSKEEENV